MYINRRRKPLPTVPEQYSEALKGLKRRKRIIASQTKSKVATYSLGVFTLLAGGGTLFVFFKGLPLMLFYSASGGSGALALSSFSAKVANWVYSRKHKKLDQQLTGKELYEAVRANADLKLPSNDLIRALDKADTLSLLRYASQQYMACWPHRLGSFGGNEVMQALAQHPQLLAHNLLGLHQEFVAQIYDMMSFAQRTTFRAALRKNVDSLYSKMETLAEDIPALFGLPGEEFRRDDVEELLNCFQMALVENKKGKELDKSKALDQLRDAWSKTPFIEPSRNTNIWND